MNLKFALIFFATFMIIRLILFYFIGWQITHITVIVAVIMSLVYGFIERNVKIN